MTDRIKPTSRFSPFIDRSKADPHKIDRKLDAVQVLSRKVVPRRLTPDKVQLRNSIEILYPNLLADAREIQDCLIATLELNYLVSPEMRNGREFIRSQTTTEPSQLFSELDLHFNIATRIDANAAAVKELIFHLIIKRCTVEDAKTKISNVLLEADEADQIRRLMLLFVLSAGLTDSCITSYPDGNNPVDSLGREVSSFFIGYKEGYQELMNSLSTDDVITSHSLPKVLANLMIIYHTFLYPDFYISPQSLEDLFSLSYFGNIPEEIKRSLLENIKNNQSQVKYDSNFTKRVAASIPGDQFLDASGDDVNGLGAKSNLLDSSNCSKVDFERILNLIRSHTYQFIKDPPIVGAKALYITSIRPNFIDILLFTTGNTVLHLQIDNDGILLGFPKGVDFVKRKEIHQALNDVLRSLLTLKREALKQQEFIPNDFFPSRSVPQVESAQIHAPQESASQGLSRRRKVEVTLPPIPKDKDKDIKSEVIIAFSTLPENVKKMLQEIHSEAENEVKDLMIILNNLLSTGSHLIDLSGHLEPLHKFTRKIKSNNGEQTINLFRLRAANARVIMALITTENGKKLFIALGASKVAKKVALYKRFNTMPNDVLSNLITAQMDLLHLKF